MPIALSPSGLTHADAAPVLAAGFLHLPLPGALPICRARRAELYGTECLLICRTTPEITFSPYVDVSACLGLPPKIH